MHQFAQPKDIGVRIESKTQFFKNTSFLFLKVLQRENIGKLVFGNGGRLLNLTSQ